MGGLGASFLVRRARSSWLLLTCVVVTVLLASGLTAVLWSFADAVVPTGAESFLAAPQSRSFAISGVANAGEAAADSQVISSILRKAWPGVGFQMESALWAEPLGLSAPVQTATPPGAGPGQPGSPGGPPAQGPTITQIRLASLEGISAQATLTAGTWPGPPRHGDPLPVALPVAAASALHLKLGSVLTATPESGATPVSVRVTGLYKAKDPASVYWGVDLLPASGISTGTYNTSSAMMTITGNTITYGPAVVNPAAFAGALGATQASWEVVPQATAMANGNIAALAASTGNAVSQLAVTLPDGLQVTSGLPQLLNGLASTIVLTRSLFAIAALMLLLVAGAALVLAARLLASLREEESALLRARGATRWQLTRPALAEAVLLGAVAGLVGVLAGARLTGALASLGNLRLEGSPDRITTLAWLSALVVVVLCAVIMAWPALRAPDPGAARRRRSRQARLAGIAWAGGDVALVVLAAVAVWELHGYSAVSHPATGSLGIDPVVAIAPALALAGVAIIPLRGLPLLARLADKATDRERRLAAAMVSWQIARRPIRQAGPALLVVVATATTTLALAGYTSWRQSTWDQASFVVGSDVRVDSPGGLPLSAEQAITQAPGVTAATEASVVNIGNGGQLIALGASTASTTILLRPDLSPLPLSTLWQRIIPPASGLALPGEPDRLEITAALGAGPQTSAAEMRSGLASVTVMAWIEDASGGTYQIPAAGQLPADGQPHSLVFTMSAPRQALYPLRLIGFTVTFGLPPYDPARPAYAPSGALTVESLAVSGTAKGPFGAPFAHGTALAAWLANAGSGAVPIGPANPNGGAPLPSDGNPPSFLAWKHVAGGGQRLTFNTGHDPSEQVQLLYGFDPAQATGQVTMTAQPKDYPIPAIATNAYLTANHLGVGSYIQVPLDRSFQATVQIVASVANFPTVYGQKGALIADLAQTNALLVANNEMPLQVTRWWLSTVDGRPPRLPAGLGLTVTDRASQQAALFGNPLLTAPRQATLAIGVAAVLLGVLGFSVSVAASLRSRRTQSAVFAALGVGKNAQAGQLCLEQCALSFPAAAAGLLAGIGLAELMVPAITLTSDATAPLPSALVIVPLGPAIALALVTAVLPAAAAALSVLRRPDPATQLRAEAG
jgi:ABC-type antimicrobial peptide transport system permease subunit